MVMRTGTGIFSSYNPAIFKGLESDVIMLVIGNNLKDSQIPNVFYVQGSRAKHALYIYKRDALKDAC